MKWKESQIKEEIKEPGNKNDIIIDSKIIDKNEQIELLANKLKSKEFNKNKKLKFNLIYRASRDGDSPNNYHNKCDKKAKTLCVIETIKGCKFGGYSQTMISSSCKDYKDQNSFVFSLNKMKIYENLKKDESAVCHYSGWGPVFKNTFAVWNHNFFSFKKQTVGKKSDSNFGKMDEDYEINNREENFTIKELEVFQILIE